MGLSIRVRTRLTSVGAIIGAGVQVFTLFAPGLALFLLTVPRLRVGSRG